MKVSWTARIRSLYAGGCAAYVAGLIAMLLALLLHAFDHSAGSTQRGLRWMVSPPVLLKVAGVVFVYTLFSVALHWITRAPHRSGEGRL